MSKQAPIIEWQIPKDDAEWAELCVSTLAADESRSRIRLLYEGMVCLLLLGCASGWWWYTTRSEPQQITMEAAETLQQEELVLAQAVDSATVSIADIKHAVNWQDPYSRALRNVQLDEPQPNLTLGLHMIDVRGDQAVARLIGTGQDGLSMYRQVRFYQRSGKGWVRTAPDTALWGAPQQVETPLFVYRFQQKDARTVTAVTSQVDALYRKLRHDWGLPTQVDEEKAIITVSITQRPAKSEPKLGDAPARMDVLSPALYWTSVETTETALLEQSIALLLLKHVSRQANEQHAINAQWQPLLRGLRLWEAWNMSLPSAGSRKEVVQWLYADPPTSYPKQPILLPNYYAASCAIYQLWKPTPVQMNLPLLCLEVSEEIWYASTWGPLHPLTHLYQLFAPTQYGADVPPTFLKASEWSQTVASATLIEYAVAAHGPEKLPALVVGLGQTTRWEPLLASVYGVSVAEFEAGWQAYLVEHYYTQ